VLAETEIITRQIAVVSTKGDGNALHIEDDGGEIAVEQTAAASKGHLKEWWAPLLKMKFDDPEQQPPYWVGTNNIVLNTPYPGIQIKAWSSVDRGPLGVFLSGTRADNVDAVREQIRRDRPYLIDNLPTGTRVDAQELYPVMLQNSDALSDVDRRAWLKKSLNTFVNVLRPRLAKWYGETRG
jgi:hypothetical protein